MSETPGIVLLTLRVALVATLLNLPLGIFFGWLFARRSFRGKTLLDGLVNVPLVLPPVVTGYFLLVVLGPSGVVGRLLQNWFGLQIAFTWKAAVVAAAAVSLPLLVRSVRVAVEGVDPRLEEAARMLRANEWGVFFRVTLPLALNGVVSGAVLAFARGLGEFGATILFASNIPGRTQTISLAIFTYFNQPGAQGKVNLLVAISIALSYVSILLNEALLRRYRRRARQGKEIRVQP